MKKHWFLVLTFVALVTVSAPNGLEGATLHAMIVADTTDESIGESTAVDYQNMLQEARRIAKHTGLELNEITVRDQEATPALMWQKLNAIQVAPDDAIIFYFSGHGYRTSTKGSSPWPNLYFSRVQQGVDLGLVGQKLEEKNPRFLLVMADACNNIIPDEYAPMLVAKGLFSKPNEEQIKANYRALFLDTEGVVIATSSRAGEYSWGTDTGGLFTVALLRSLKQVVESSTVPSWEKLMEKAASQTGSYQHPDYRIYLNAEADMALGG